MTIVMFILNKPIKVHVQTYLPGFQSSFCAHDMMGKPQDLESDLGLNTRIAQLSVFFMVQLSHPYMTTGKTIALTRQTFVGKVISLLFNMLSRLVIAFLLRSKHLLISWLQSLSAVILKHKKIKSIIVSIFSLSLCHEVMGLDDLILVF